MHAADESIHIAISFDQGYVTYVYVLLTSVLYHNRHEQVVVHALAPEVLAADQDALRGFVAERGGQIIFYSLSADATRGFALPDHAGAYLSVASYYRLFFAALVPQDLKTLLYIDVDTLVVGNLAELYRTELGDFAIGAVEEIEMPLRPELGITDRHDYFNAGVLLINLLQWRLQRVTERTSDIAIHHPDKVREYADQDALNMLFRGAWRRLDWRYNVMKAYIPHDLPRRSYQRFLTDKVIIHYNGALKPWHLACDNKFRFLYFDYLQRSPRAGTKRYAKRKLTRQGVAKLLMSRALETYFNYPLVGQTWRRFKSIIRGA